MCYAIPGKVKSIQNKSVIVDYFGEEKRAHNELAGLSVGDFVYAQGGFVISRISEREAQEILAAWKETFFDLQEVDVSLSRMESAETGADRRVAAILDRISSGGAPKKEDLLYLMDREDQESKDLLFKTANFLRQKHLKNSCCVHGVLEISNECRETCAYCGISLHNQSLPRYQMTPEEVVGAAREAIDRYGFKALVLQSGEHSNYSIAELAGMIRGIKEKSPALIFVSFGEVGIAGLKELYEAGARGLLMRFETSNSALYKKFHPGSSLETRLEHLREAYKMGYLIITGGLIGLPGQTREDILNDLYLTKELNAEMYSFGPFLPHPNTPLENVSPVSEMEVLKTLALARLLEPTEARILITTAFETLSPEARRLGLMSGGNSVMLNVTPERYRKHYAIYPNRAHAQDSIQNQIDETLALLHSLGRAPTDLGAK